MPYKREMLQAAVNFQPLAQPSSTDVPDLIMVLQHTRECSPPPPLPLPTSPPQQTNQGQKLMPYKMELLQAAVDFQNLAQPSSTDVPDLVTGLQHTRECSPPPPLPLPASPLQQTNQGQKLKCLTRESACRLLLTFSPSPNHLAPTSPI
jgi:hypothetical protein